MGEGKGNCMENASKFVLQSTEGVFGTPPGDVKLCHGICVGQGPIEGIRHVHAWVEMTIEMSPSNSFVFCLDAGEPIEWGVKDGCEIFQKDHYYELGQIEEENVVRYSRNQMLAQMRFTEHYGPWSSIFKGVA
jgi:hypothetical protein